MANRADANRLDLCRAYFEHEHGVSVHPASTRRPTFVRLRGYAALVRAGDVRAVPTLLDYGTMRQLRQAGVHRLLGTFVPRHRFRSVLSVDGPVPPGLVLLPRRTGCLVALRRGTRQVVKVMHRDGYPFLDHEHACLLHLRDVGMEDFATLPPVSSAVHDYAFRGRTYRILRTTYHRNSRPVTAAEWASLQREWLLPRMFDFYASWGIEKVDAAEHVASIQRQLSERGLGPDTQPLIDLLHRTRSAAQVRAVHVTRCHGDLKPGNVQRHGSDLRLIDWANSIEANLFFDLGVQFLNAHHYAERKSKYVSTSMGLNVHDETTLGAATPFVRHASALTGEHYDAGQLAFHVLCSFAERLIFTARAWSRHPEEDRTHAKLLASLKAAGLVGSDDDPQLSRRMAVDGLEQKTAS